MASQKPASFSTPLGDRPLSMRGVWPVSVMCAPLFNYNHHILACADAILFFAAGVIVAATATKTHILSLFYNCAPVALLSIWHFLFVPAKISGLSLQQYLCPLCECVAVAARHRQRTVRLRSWRKIYGDKLWKFLRLYLSHSLSRHCVRRPSVRESVPNFLIN